MMDVTARISTAIEYASDTPADISIQPGGSAATTAAWMASRGHPTTFVGCVGDDAFGSEVGDALRSAGVDVRLGVFDNRPTGTCIVIVDASRERTMFPDKGANDLLDAAAVDAVHLMPGEHVHLSGYVLLNPYARDAGVAILKAARAARATTSLDPASAGPLRECRELVLGLLPMIDLVIANEDEATVLTGAADAGAALDLLARLVPTAVVKRGSRGVLARAESGSVDQPAPATAVVDTTGAGDAFAAGFLVQWLAGSTLDEAVRAGQVLAAVAVGRVGAGPAGR